MPRLAGRLVRAACLAVATGGCAYGRLMYYNAPSLSAATRFDARPVAASSRPIALPRAIQPPAPLTAAERARYGSFDRLLREIRG